MATDKVFDVGVASIDNDGNINAAGIDSEGDDLSVSSATNNVRLGPDQGVYIGGESTNAVFIEGDNLTIFSLPTSDPAVSEQLWNNGGVLTVSAG